MSPQEVNGERLFLPVHDSMMSMRTGSRRDRSCGTGPPCETTSLLDDDTEPRAKRMRRTEVPAEPNAKRMKRTEVPAGGGAAVAAESGAASSLGAAEGAIGKATSEVMPRAMPRAGRTLQEMRVPKAITMWEVQECDRAVMDGLEIWVPYGTNKASQNKVRFVSREEAASAAAEIIAAVAADNACGASHVIRPLRVQPVKLMDYPVEHARNLALYPKCPPKAQPKDPPKKQPLTTTSKASPVFRPSGLRAPSEDAVVDAATVVAPVSVCHTVQMLATHVRGPFRLGMESPTGWLIEFGKQLGYFKGGSFESFCFENLHPIQVNIMVNILHHGPGVWIPRGHWVWYGCGQSCGCCRAHNQEDSQSGCEPCASGWELTCVSKSVKNMVAEYVKTVRKGYFVRCLCGRCTPRSLFVEGPCPDDSKADLGDMN